jgi:hypothetical protein
MFLWATSAAVRFNMVQFIVVNVIVGAVTACLFGVPTALYVGKKLTAAWIITGAIAIFLGPIFDLVHLVRIIIQKTIKFFSL